MVLYLELARILPCPRSLLILDDGGVTVGTPGNAGLPEIGDAQAMIAVQ